MHWKVRLVGLNCDLEELARSLVGGSLLLKPDKHNSYYLTCPQFDACLSEKDVRDVSKKILPVLNGAMRLALGGNVLLTESEVIEVRSDGTEVIYLTFVDGIGLRSSFSLSVADSDGNVIEEIKPADPVPAWVKAALVDPAIEKVLRLFGKALNWGDLYRIFEVIHGDIGGIKKVIELGWLTDAQIELFKRTANHPASAGDDARHGRQITEPPKKPMTMSEARAHIETLIHQWLRSKS